MNYILFALMLGFSQLTFALPPGVLARTALGREYVALPEALTICPEGYHLPTVREWAKWTETQGAKGILEKTVNPGNVPEGYYLIGAINPNKKVDEFYFSAEGYRRDEGEWGEYGWCFWSSSATERDPINYAYLLCTDGVIYRNTTGLFNGKAWCMPDANQR